MDRCEKDHVMETIGHIAFNEESLRDLEEINRAPKWVIKNLKTHWLNGWEVVVCRKCKEVQVIPS